MKIKNRIYLDFNASSPLASSVKDYLAKGDFFYGNPSSIHSSGKRSRRAISQVENYLRDLYQLSDTTLVYFHSGATEGFNTLLQGSAKAFFRSGQKVQYLLGKADHSCVVNQEEDLKDFGHEVNFYSPDANGNYQKQAIIDQIKAFDGPSVMTFTWVNNETGIVNSLELAKEIKAETGCYLIVDGVQSIGKIEQWQTICHDLDGYIFSGHKFGALKGVGWSFVDINFPFAPLLRGGGQQGGLRSGTENTDGIYSLKLALAELIERQASFPINAFMQDFESELLQKLSGHGELVGQQASLRAKGTFYIILNKQKADITLIAFDLDSIDVSSGSACSSGALEPSRVLKSMGYDDNEAKSALRVSFPFAFDQAEYETMKQAFYKVLDRFLN